MSIFSGVLLCLMADSPHLKKLKALDLSGNELSNSMELQGKFFSDYLTL